MLKIRRSTLVRLTLALLGFFGGLFVSPYAAFVPMIALALFWRSPEVLFLGFFLDCMWSPAGQIPYILIASIALIWLFEPIRKEFLL